MPLLTQTKTRISVTTKVLLVTLSLSGIALAGAILTQPGDIEETVVGLGAPVVTGNLSCTETDKLANFKAKGTLVVKNTVTKKVVIKKVDTCGRNNTLTEYYCDNLSENGFSTWTYKCASCAGGACQKLKCVTNADCSDRYAYTIGTCNANKVCEFKPITKYFELVLKNGPGLDKLSLYSGSVKDITAGTDTDQLFAKDDSGFVAEYTSIGGIKSDIFSFDLTKDYVRKFKIEKGELVEDEFFTVRLPYGSDSYQAIEIFSPGKKQSLGRIELGSLPLAVEATTGVIQEIASIQNETYPSGKVLGVVVGPGSLCGTKYPQTNPVIPADVQFTDQTGGSYPEGKMREAFLAALRHYGPKMTEMLTKNVVFATQKYVNQECGGDNVYSGCYDNLSDTIIIGVEKPDSISTIIVHEAAHATHLTPLKSCLFQIGVLCNSARTNGDWKGLHSSYTGNLDNVSKWNSDCQAGYFYNGFAREYGMMNINEDVATFAEVFLKNPGMFVNYVADRNGVYYKKLSLMRDLGIVTQEQFDVIANCKCLGTDIMSNTCDRAQDNDPFVKGDGDECQGLNDINESVCRDGRKEVTALTCPLGGCLEGACASCAVLAKENLIKYYTKGQPFPPYKSNEKKKQECENAKTLLERSCSPIRFAEPILSRTVCADKCANDPADGIDKCMTCPAGSCKGDDIGKTKCFNINEGPRYQKCEDQDGDGCGTWVDKSCAAGEVCTTELNTASCVKSPFCYAACNAGEPNFAANICLSEHWYADCTGHQIECPGMQGTQYKYTRMGKLCPPGQVCRKLSGYPNYGCVTP